jgi:hypothetical protein
LRSSWPEGASDSGKAARPEGAAATTSGAAARVGTTWNSSTTRGAAARPEGAAAWPEGAAARVGDGLDDGLDDERSSSAPGGPASCPDALPTGAAEAGRRGRELWRVPSSGACPASSGARAQRARARALRLPVRDFEFGPRWRRNVSGRGVLQKFYLMGWAAGGPSNSGRRE